MFEGNYNFFDYKYNILGYNGQDFGSNAQYIYLLVSILLMIILLLVLRKSSREKVLKIIKTIGIFLIMFYITKTAWESIYDIRLTGSFNTGLLPLDTCSVVMLAAMLAGFSKGKAKDYSECWLVTGSIVGGLSNMLFLNALKYYPFFTFGAFYSMIWHFLMVFLGLLLIVTNYVKIEYKTIIKGFILHLLISLLVIPIDFVFNFDFMLYLNLGGIPIFEDIASSLTSLNLQIINPVLMLLLYYISFNIVFMIPLLIKTLQKTKSSVIIH